MHVMNVDIETYSSVDIKESGVYAYAAAPDFEILLIGYRLDGGRVEVIDLTDPLYAPEDYPEFWNSLVDPDVVKTAYNANFERTCLAAWTGKPMQPVQWQCTAVHAATLGLPGNLASVGAALGLPQDKQKGAAGKRLIDYFCKPCKPTKVNGGRTRNLPEHAPEKWEEFIEYNRQDVVAEEAIRDRLAVYKIPESEQELWNLDQNMNDNGVLLDMDLVNKIIRYDAIYRERLMVEARELTGLSNPNSLAQLKDWFLCKYQMEIKSITKDTIPEIHKQLEELEFMYDIAPAVRMLRIRQELGKTSVKKYIAMEHAVCPDGRLRGILQFYGANRTGRWCLTGDHEVLTDTGWVRLDEWSGGRIACWNPAGEIVSFQTANALSFPYKGDVYEYRDKRIAQKSTPDHRMYVKRRYGGEWGVDTIENMLAYRPSIPFTGYRRTLSGMEHQNLRVLIMTQADGHYTADGNIRFHFAKQRKMERCKSLLRAADIAYTYSVNGQSGKPTYSFTIYARNLPLWLRMFQNKTFGPWLFDESADVFFEELAYWDGYRSAANSIQYVTCNKQNADIVQAFAHISGRCAIVKVKNRSNNHPNWKDAYVVDIWLTPNNCHEIRKKPEVTKFEGTVYCAETKTGFFLVRRAGRVWITGNSGRIVQVQNLPQNKIPDLDLARQLVKEEDFETMELLFEGIPFVFSQLIRTAFIPSPGCRFVVSDFSAIEARVIAWLADETWRLEVFRTHGKIYEASASQMFHVPIETIKKGSKLRQQGKVAELALGYGGGFGAMKAMDRAGSIPDDEIPMLISNWRKASPNICRFWYNAEGAAKTAIKEHRIVKLKHGITCSYINRILFVGLPSGRKLAYYGARIEENAKGRDVITYAGVNQETKAWGRLETWGGKLVENIVQAVARDCLAETIRRVSVAGYKVVMHVHDEIIVDAPREKKDALKEITDIMAQPISWAPGLPLKGDGYETDYYKKD